MDILLTWVGSRDPAWDNPRTKQREFGPILSLLQSRHFDIVYLLYNLDSATDREGWTFPRRATTVQRWCERNMSATTVRQQPLNIISVIDYREIYRVTNDTCQRILKDEGQEGQNYFVFLSPGTPQMQTIWVLLVQSGLLPARMIATTPHDLVVPGYPIWEEVDLSIPSFPQVVSPGETARLLGVLEAQTKNLQAENQRLKSELELQRTGAEVSADGMIGEGFQLRDYLLAQERAMYLRALDQARGNAAEAARLLGLDPAAFRARAVTLGIRQRRRARRPMT